MSTRIYYLAPDYDVPSWGNGMLYHHVRLLRELGFESFVLHQRAPFRMSWIDVDVPIVHLDGGAAERHVRPEPGDVLVVPEVQAHSAAVAAIHCRKVVFIQGGFLILTAFDRANTYPELGFEAAMAVMPHIAEIVAHHCGITPAIVPPFIASYFFVDENRLDSLRRKRILLVGKAEYRKAGYLDFDIARKLLERFVARRGDWELLELAGFDHRRTAEIMKESAVMLNVNSLESFNAQVAEAMAAGCLPFCYEAYGGRDYLCSGVNAFVWPNNYVYPLLDQLFEMLDSFEDRSAKLATMRRAARKTADLFREEGTARELSRFYEELLCGHRY